MSLDALVSKGKVEGAIYWTMDKPDPSHFRENPFYLVMARRNFEGFPFLYYPLVKSFAAGYGKGAYQLLNKDVRPKIIERFPLFGEYFVCVDDEKGDANSVITILITRGTVVVRDMSYNPKTFPEYFRKRDALFRYEGSTPFVETAKIIAGRYVKEAASYDAAQTRVIHCSNTKILGSNLRLVDLMQPVVVVAARGDASHLVTKSAKAALLFSRGDVAESRVYPQPVSNRRQKLCEAVAA